jgi:hypothetical protein
MREVRDKRETREMRDERDKRWERISENTVSSKALVGFRFLPGWKVSSKSEKQILLSLCLSMYCTICKHLVNLVNPFISLLSPLPLSLLQYFRY